MEDNLKIKKILKKSVYFFIVILIIAVIGLMILRYHVEGEQNMPFNLSEILVVSTAEGYEEEVKEENNWNFEIYQTNDVYLTIKKNKNYKETQAIKSIEIKNLTKKFSTKTDEVIAVNDVSYKFENGKFYAIMGHSGSGKSTLISILGTLEKPTNGNCIIGEKDISNLDDNTLSKIRNKNIGFIFQNYALDPNLKSFENVMLPMYINENIKKEERKNKAIELLKYVNLESRIEHYPNELSGGEQQRVAIARALANDPDIILADEPTGNLDEKNEEIIFNILKKISASGRCVIVVCHNNNILKYADVVLEMQNGKLGVKNER